MVMYQVTKLSMSLPKIRSKRTMLYSILHSQDGVQYCPYTE